MCLLRGKARAALYRFDEEALRPYFRWKAVAGLFDLVHACTACARAEAARRCGTKRPLLQRPTKRRVPGRLLHDGSRAKTTRGAGWMANHRRREGANSARSGRLRQPARRWAASPPRLFRAGTNRVEAAQNSRSRRGRCNSGRLRPHRRGASCSIASVQAVHRSNRRPPPVPREVWPQSFFVEIVQRGALLFRVVATSSPHSARPGLRATAGLTARISRERASVFTYQMSRKAARARHRAMRSFRPGREVCVAAAGPLVRSSRMRGSRRVEPPSCGHAEIRNPGMGIVQVKVVTAKLIWRVQGLKRQPSALRRRSRGAPRRWRKPQAAAW